MDQSARKIVHYARTVLAAGDSLRFKHEMIHDQLTSFFKKITKGHGAFWSVECILLLDSHHRKTEPNFGEPIAFMVERLFPGKEFLARRQPFISRDNVRKVHFLLFSSRFLPRPIASRKPRGLRLLILVATFDPSESCRKFGFVAALGGAVE
jgi:hypothetical protein